MSFAYIRRAYGVPAKRGARVTIEGRPGTVTSARSGHVRVRMDGEKYSRPYHPTWNVSWSEVSE